MITVEVINDYNQKLYIESQLIKSLILNVLEFEGVCEADLIFILSTQNYLNKLKKSFFSKDHYTDVIAFNYNESNESLVGDIFISLDRVEENSLKYSDSLDSELMRVLIHGALHLIGYEDNDKEKKKIMTNKENYYLKLFEKFKLCNG